MESGNLGNLHGGRYALRTRDKSGRSGGAAMDIGVVKEKGSSVGKRVRGCPKRKETNLAEPPLIASKAVRKRKAGRDADINPTSVKRQKTPEVLPPTPASESRKSTTRQRSHGSAIATHLYNTRVNQISREDTSCSTPESNLDKIQTHSNSNDVPEGTEDTSFQTADHQITAIPNLPSDSRFANLEMQQPTLDPPFEYIPSHGTREMQEEGTQGSDMRLPEILPMEPEFARLLDYTRPGEAGTGGLDILAGVASQSSNETFIQLSETSTPKSTAIVEAVERDHTVPEVTATAQEASVANKMERLDMQEIIPGLYLGSSSVFSASHIDMFRSLNIGKIFTIRRRREITTPWEMQASRIVQNDESINRKWLEISDHSFEVLLDTDRLPNIVAEINSALAADERVFVHCLKGVSRSPAIIIAYLMSHKEMSYEEARRHVQTCRPNIEPNNGFTLQLQVWNAIKHNWENRHTYPEYQHWLATRRMGVITNNRDKYGGRTIMFGHRHPLQKVLTDDVETFPNPATLDDSVNAMSSFPGIQRPVDSYYRCCRCHYPLAPAHSAFNLTPEHNIFTDLPVCTHIFLASRLSWMTVQMDTAAPGGRLYCPECSNVTQGPYYVGEYCWMGVQCENAECGEIVSPGLALIRRLEGETIVGVEFRQVDEDGDEYFSSQETLESNDADDDDDDDDQEPGFAVPPTDYFAREDNGPWEEQENNFFEAFNIEAITQPTSSHGERQPIVGVPTRQSPRRSRRPRTFHPYRQNNSNSPQYLRYVPITPSRLRNTWIPRSMPSSDCNSQESQESQESVNFQTSQTDFATSVSASFDEERPSQVLQWLSGIQGSQQTSTEVLGAIDEYLTSDGHSSN